MACLLAALASCDGSNDINGGNSSGGPYTSSSCTGDPDQPTSCTYWTCTDAPAQYAHKTHCTSSQPPGMPHPGGDYTCPESGGGLYCPGNDAGGSGPWTCHADDVGLTCDRGGSSGGGPGYPGAGTGSGGPLPGGTVDCYYSGGGGTSGPPPGATPAATLEHAIESLNGVSVVHVRLTFDPSFVDNTYGTTAVGWPGGHKYTDLVGSDHAELLMKDTTGTIVLDYKLDYISASTTVPTGYKNLGISGGDGRMVIGSPAAIAATMTSLDRNFNERGYSSYTVSSPATDASYTPNPAAPAWDYRVVYEAWVRTDTFTAGFGSVLLTYVHASPSKTGSNTETVSPHPCPPAWTVQ